MGKKGTDRGEILGYINDGWHFRVKMSKGRRYITRRRGQKERGMGHYDEGFWNMISQLVQRVAESEAPEPRDGGVRGTEVGERLEDKPWWVNFDEDFRDLIEQLSMYRGTVMMMSCEHRDEEGLCTYWSWEDEPGFFGSLKKLRLDDFCWRKMLTGGEDSERWFLRVTHWYCWGCPAYHQLQ